MLDPLTLLLVGAGVLTFRELNRKDYGVLTPSRDERYRNAMEYCHQPDMLLEESKLFNEYGLKAQAKMLQRRAEWRARSPEVKKAHEEVFQKALKSTNIAAILQVAEAFEGWTATKKATELRERVHTLQEASIQEVAQRAAEAVESSDTDKKPKKDKRTNGAGKVHNEPTETIEVPRTGEDT